MAVYSHAFSNLYDKIMENYEDIVHPTQKLVYEYTQRKNKVSLLELGCGTGNILKIFPQSFTLYGLDISHDMLAIARKKVKAATFYDGDMSNFSLSKKFDVIISVFDSINHLLEFKQWQNMFTSVSNHLKKDGVFIFDINTEKRHKALTLLPGYVKKRGNRIICTKILQTDKNIFTARFEVFSGINKDNVILFEENIPEASFSTQKVIKALRKHFTIEKMVDPYREKVTKDSGRIFFVCKRIVRE